MDKLHFEEMLMGINKQKRDWIGVHTWLCVLVPFAVQPWCRDRWAVEEGAVLALLRARSGYKLNSMLLDFHNQGSAGVIKVCILIDTQSRFVLAVFDGILEPPYFWKQRTGQG